MKIVVLGGGLSGLAASYKLSKAGNELTILEKESFLGGLASSYSIDWEGKNYWITKTYHHILHGDDATVNLIKELGIGEKIHKKRVGTGFLYKSKIWKFSSPIEILRFPLPLYDKIKLAKFILKISKKVNWDDAEGMNAKDWIIKEAGEKNFEILFRQLIWNKFHEPAEKISAPWFGTRFAKEPTSFLKKFGWLEGGVQQIIDLMKKNIEESSGTIKLGVQIRKIIEEKKKVIYVENGQVKEEGFDILISTLPPQTFLELIDEVPEDLRSKLEGIKYLSCICACIGLKKIPTNVYWTNILDGNLPFVVIFNHTALYEDSAPSGKCVLYLVTYLRKDEEFWKKTEKEIFDIYMKSFNEIFPGFDANVEWYRIEKFKDAEAIYSLNFENPPISKDGMYFAGIYRIYPKIRNMASAIESGFEVANKILDDYAK